jgi:hypothetical protein
VRPERRPDPETPARPLDVLAAGRRDLPSVALSLAAGGTIAVEPASAGGRTALDPFFEVRLRPADAAYLRHGQRVCVRLEFTPKPLAAQWWRAVAQLVQRKFHTGDALPGH